jgi:DNA polymerase-4
VKTTIRYSDWEENERSETIGATSIDEDVQPAARRLLEQIYARRVTIRKVGVVLSNLRAEEPQRDLFSDDRLKRLHEAIDRIRDKYGDGAVILGKAIDLLGRLPSDAYGYVLRTPSLTK